MSNSLITKKALAEALKLLMRKTPFSKLSIADICSTAGLSRRSFYRHFRDKYELLNWIYYEDFCVLINRIPLKRSLDMFPFVCRHLYSDRKFYIHAFEVEGQNSFRSYCAERLYPHLARDYSSAFQNSYEEHFYIDRVMSGIFDCLQEWLKAEPCTPPDEFAEQITDSITRFAVLFAKVATRELPESEEGFEGQSGLLETENP